MPALLKEKPTQKQRLGGVAHVGLDHGAFSAISKETCNLAIWERPSMPEVETLMDIDAQDIRFTAPLHAITAELAAQMSASGFANLPVKAAFIQDVAKLAKAFAKTTGSNQVEVRLEVVTTNACRKFHADFVPARLITTYVGSGTQWLDQDDADRVARGEEPKSIRALTPGDVGIFKGKLATRYPAIHRSPPIEGTGERRLLLVLNPSE